MSNKFQSKSSESTCSSRNPKRIHTERKLGIQTRKLRPRQLSTNTKVINIPDNTITQITSLVNKKDSKKQQKLTNDDDWGQCHQNQYGNNFCPRHTNTQSQGIFSQIRSQQSSFHQGPHDQVQIYSSESQTHNDPSTLDNFAIIVIIAHLLLQDIYHCITGTITQVNTVNKCKLKIKIMTMKQ